MIGDLGPQLFNVTIGPGALRERVIADIQRQLGQEQGLSRDDRDRLTAEIADDILGYGPLERLLADDTITEIMVNGPNEIWIERQGRLYETTVRFNDDSHLRRIINKIVAQVGRRDRRVVADGRRAPARRQPRQRDHPAALAQRPADHDPEVREEAADARRHDRDRDAHVRGAVDFLAALRRAPS